MKFATSKIVFMPTFWKLSRMWISFIALISFASDRTSPFIFVHFRVQKRSNWIYFQITCNCFFLWNLAILFAWYFLSNWVQMSKLPIICIGDRPSICRETVSSALRAFGVQSGSATESSVLCETLCGRSQLLLWWLAGEEPRSSAVWDSVASCQ